MSWDKPILKQGKVGKVLFISLLSFLFRPNQTIFAACFFLDSTIDYLAQYRLVDRSRLEMYGRAFTLEDDDEDGIISYEVFQFCVYIRRDNENQLISTKKELCQWSIVQRKSKRKLSRFFACFLTKLFSTMKCNLIIFVFLSANAACLRGCTKHCRDVSETTFVCITGKILSAWVAWER